MVRFGLDARLSPPVLVFGSLQWLLFMLPANILVPLILGHILRLSPAETGSYISQMFVVTGVASILQVWLGHRLPLMEGPAGLWFAVFIAAAGSASAFGQDGRWVMRNLQGGMLVAGGLVAAIGLLGLAHRVRHLFGPVVTGTFLVLMPLQISGTLVPGLLGVNAERGLHVPTALTALGILVLVLVLSQVGPGLVRTFALLIGTVVGWLVFALLGLGGFAPAPASAVIALPSLFPWGQPGFDLALVITLVVTALANLGNVMGALAAMEQVLGQPFPAPTYERGTTWCGVGHMLAGASGSIGTSPFAAGAGAVAVTGLATRLPFLIAAVLILLLGLVPAFGMAAAAIPSPVGNAVTLVAFIQILGFGLADVARAGLSQQSVFRVALPILLGTGLLLVPAPALAGLPVLVRLLAGNGVIVGTLLALALDVCLPRGRSAPARPGAR